MKKISIFGLGYVGCVSAACFASSGYEVIGVDLNADKVKMINQGMSPIVEPGLDEMLQAVVAAGKLRATDSCQQAIDESDLVFVCVGTPGDQHGQLQLDALKRVCQEIGAALRGTQREYTVVIRSTVLPGTLHGLVIPALIEGAGEEFRPFLHVASNPEFIREGTALKDFRNPPFTLVGSDDSATQFLLRTIYAGVEAPFVQTTVETAETVKYVSNTFHALKVSFANEIGDACNAFGVDSAEVMRIVCLDRKLNISEAYMKPGFAFGGSCLPKDIKALLYAAHHRDVSLPLLESILPSNRAQIQHGIDAVLSHGKKRVGMVGLSFKSNTDDLRESPLVTLVEALIGKGCDMRILDRNVSIARLTGSNRKYIEEEIPHISSLMCETTVGLLEHAQVVVIGSDSAEAKQVMQGLRDDQILIDLTRTAGKLVDGKQAKVAA
ncbi:MAG: nucleotide sugar dehydrogenase [Pseudomonadota bacterium]